MLTLGSLSFAAPWLLAAFLGLPILWWLLRLTPPSPKEIAFPAIRLLFGLKPKEETPDRTPWWLVLLRLLIAAFVILGLSHPVWNEGRNFARAGPLMLVIDNGWASAPQWDETMAAGEALIDQAEREARTVLLLPTAPALGTDKLVVPDQMAPAAAKAALAALQPLPWPTRRDLAGPAAKQALPGTDANIAWLSDGLSQDGKIDADFAAMLGERGDVAIMAPSTARRFLVRPPRLNVDGLVVPAEREISGGQENLTLRALDTSGHSLAIVKGSFAPDKRATEIAMPLPIELRARVAVVAIEDTSSAAGIALLDEMGGQRPIGIISVISSPQDRPLLSELYYLERALKPRGELRVGPLVTLLKQPIAILVLPDQSILAPEETKALSGWIEKGGMLIRFAGERLAGEPAASGPKLDLLPVHLRQGDRVLGGALSWSEPARLAPFPAGSPFAGLAVPKDVIVKRQVLAEPDIELGKRTWARLEDGTPLVTGTARGKGAIVLFHVGANAEWSDLPLSGLFVEMLDRLILLSEGVDAASNDKSIPLPPAQILDGFGRLGPAPAGVQSLSPGAFARQSVGPMNPPGLYGPPKARRALNLGAALKSPEPLSLVATPLAKTRVIDWKPWLLLSAFLLLLADFLLALVLRGLVGRASFGRSTGFAGAGAAFVFVMLASQPPVAAEDIVQPMTDEEIVEATLTTRLAFIRTGVPEIDATSRAGLTGLTTLLLERTSADMGAPVGLDLEVDTLEFYPLIYWPMSAGQESLSERASTKVNRYLAAGGLILFDTADQSIAGMTGGTGPGVQRLQEIAAGLDIPPLVPVPGNHVLTRAFYLLKDFPGRWLGGTLWVENAKGRVNDGVASVLVGSNDYAGAWALNDLGQPLFPVTPGGERQREMAYRFGINLVMYALTGNYKSDQVHVPSILERLGQ